MSEGLNRVILIGNLGADPELKFLDGGQAVMRLRLATTEKYADRGGERKERTEWHSVTVWGKRAEALNKILAKGRTICVEGRIQYRQWDDKDGNKRTATDIVATEIILLGGGNREGQRPNAGGGSSGNDGGGYGSDEFGDQGDVPF